MNPEELYKHGYQDGSNRFPLSPSFSSDDNYRMGYQDGQGDFTEGTVSEVERQGNESKFIKEETKALVPAPLGFEYTGEHRTPQRGELYLTKNGNAGTASTPKNGRKRWILKKVR